MHIAMFAHYALPHAGGIETVVDALTRRLSARHRVTIVTSDWAGLEGPTRDGAVTTWRLPSIHASERYGVPYPVPTGRYVHEALAEAGEAQVMHAHGAVYPETILARRLSARTGIPLVLTEHVGWVPYPGAVLQAVQGAAWRFVGDDTLRRASVVVALNGRVDDWLAKRDPSRPRQLIPNGVDLARFAPPTDAERVQARSVLGLPADEVLGLLVGRDAPKKRRKDVIATPRTGWTLVLAGAPRVIHANGIVDLGMVASEGMPLLYHACDFLVHAAEGEGFPMAVQEAMATALPVALRWDAGYEATLDRDLVGAASDIEGTMRLADALAADQARRSEMGRRAHAWATAHWSWDVSVSAYEALYESLVNGA